MRRTYFNLGFKSHCSLGLSNLNNILGFLDCKCFSLLLNRNYFSNNVCSCCRGLDRGSCSAHRSSSCPGPHRPPTPAGTPAACWQIPIYIQAVIYQLSGTYRHPNSLLADTYNLYMCY